MTTLTEKLPIPPLWMGLWVPFLAAAWLLPNHYYPWATFHTDAWVAVAMSIAAGAVIFRATPSTQWHGLPVLIACLATLPAFQFAVGMIPFSGQALLYIAYVLGFLLALLTGARWEAATPGKSADALFLAIGVAALASVGLQLRQWLGIGADPGELQVWAEEFTPGRPSANLGQPNQLATLLLWALVGCGWAVVRRRVRPGGAAVAALLIVFGLALTQSRAGALGLFAITVAAWLWRRLLPSRTAPVMTLLFLFFLTCTVSMQTLSDVLGLNLQIRPATLGGASSQLRLKAYALFLDAVAQKPLWGYGWDQLAVAQLSVAEKHGTLTSFFLHSHNLFLDLVLWCGVPIGGFVSLCLAWWFVRAARKVSSAEDALLIMFLVAVGIHAMVELPLHHAYFLLPTGLVMGILNQRQNIRVWWTSRRHAVFVLWLAGCVLLGTIIRDYLRVDESFRQYKLDAHHIGNLPLASPPEVLVLNQLRAFIVNSRVEILPGFKAEDLHALWGLTVSYPTPANMLNYARALAFLHRSEEAREWIMKVQRVQPAEFNPDMARIWAEQAKKYPDMAKIEWPVYDLAQPVPVTAHEGNKN